MANENEENKMNFFYLEDEEELRTKKTVVRKRIKGQDGRKEKGNEKKKNFNKENQENIDGKFSFEDEIVIGVTKKKEEAKKESKKKENLKQKNKKKNSNKTINKDGQKKSNNKNYENNIQKNSKKDKKKDKNKQVNKEKIENKPNNSAKTQKKKKITKIIKYSSIILLIISVVIIAMFSPLFNIKKIEVVGNQKITTNEILSLSQIQLEENMFKLNKREIIEQIKENAYIDIVNIERNLPSSITIKVKERSPSYLIEYAGSYIYVDAQGYLLEISIEKLDLPILQGASTDNSKFVVGKRLDKEDLEKLEDVYRIMEVAKASEIASDITRIDIENIQNIKLVFEQKNKVAYLGDITNLLDKIIMIKKIMEQEASNPGEIFVNMDLNKENPIFRQTV